MPTAEELLRKSLEERRAKPLQAVNDLKEVVAEVAAAVSKVTDDKVRVVLEPMKPKKGSGPTFALDVRIDDDSRLLYVLSLSEFGFPIEVYEDISDWDQDVNVRGQLRAKQDLRATLLRFVSDPQSELVRIIDNHLASLSPA